MPETMGRLISALVMPLATLLSEKFAECFGRNQSPAGRIVIQCLIFIVALLPMLCVVLIVMMLLSSGLRMLFGAN
jgi:hypothetical protein